MEILPTECCDARGIRRRYDEETDTWWFSATDMIQVLTDNSNARRDGSDLKRKLAQEAGSEQPYEKTVQLKLVSHEGKERKTDCAEAVTRLRLVQSVPNPKTEPIKRWLAKVGFERMQELAAPALTLEQASKTWQRYGGGDK